MRRYLKQTLLISLLPLVTLALATLALASCGQMGPLYQPVPEPAQQGESDSGSGGL